MWPTLIPTEISKDDQLWMCMHLNVLFSVAY